MSKSAKTTVFLKECMADSLLKLMKTTPFEKITVPQITELAGVGRTTWFRNFTSKNEAVTFRLVRHWERWAEEHELSERRRYTIENIETFFEYNFFIRNTLNVIYNAGVQPAVYDAFYQVMVPQFGANAEECYQSRFYSYGLFGLLDEWIKREFFESPLEMANMFRRMVENK